MTLAAATPTALPQSPPVVHQPPNCLSTPGRIVSTIIAGMCLGLLVLACFLNPSAKGHGTHTQLGLPACGWAIFFNKPCPTCGMTTSFAYAARGQIGKAFVTQPAGTLIALACAVTFWGALHGAVFGSRVDRLVLPLFQPRWLWLGAGIILAAWTYKLVTWPGR